MYGMLLWKNNFSRKETKNGMNERERERERERDGRHVLETNVTFYEFVGLTVCFKPNYVDIVEGLFQNNNNAFLSRRQNSMCSCSACCRSVVFKLA